MTHNSQETGHALADVLFGDYNPAGRLVQTWPKSLDQLPDLMNYNIIRSGRTYMYFKGEPLYPFGFGLSYTTFAYSNLRLSSRKLKADGAMTVKVDITNTGQRDGEEVVQLYAKYLASIVERPTANSSPSSAPPSAKAKPKRCNSSSPPPNSPTTTTRRSPSPSNPANSNSSSAPPPPTSAKPPRQPSASTSYTLRRAFGVPPSGGSPLPRRGANLVACHPKAPPTRFVQSGNVRSRKAGQR